MLYRLQSMIGDVDATLDGGIPWPVTDELFTNTPVTRGTTRSETYCAAPG